MGFPNLNANNSGSADCVAVAAAPMMGVPYKFLRGMHHV